MVSVLLVVTTALVTASPLSAQQSSTNNNDLSYTTLGRRSTSINHDSGSQPHIASPPSTNRVTNSEGTNAGSGYDAGPFGGSAVLDADFLSAALTGGLIEIELGKIAMQKAESESVRKFAETVVKGNERMRSTLERIATEYKLKVPKQLDPKHRTRIDAIAKLSGSAFDRAFMRHVASYYERSLGRFDFEASNGTIPELALWAGRVTPRIRHQMKAAKEDLRAMQRPQSASKKTP
jgi:putative membrane protein